jgi:ssDNA-binding Zn-finger/Zn-ribbon topoisomerase 1
MRKYKTVSVTREEKELIAISCDNCGRNINLEDHEDKESAMFINVPYGYSSLWGDYGPDEAVNSIVLCGECSKKLLGEIIHKANQAFWDEEKEKENAPIRQDES